MEQFITDLLVKLQIGGVVLFICLLVTITASCIDTWAAYDAAKAAGRKFESKPFSKTGIKIIDYMRLTMYFALMDIIAYICIPGYMIPYCAMLATAGSLLREATSVKENYQLKKSNAAKTIDLMQQIVKCTAPEEAKRIITIITENNSEKRKRYGTDTTEKI